jgi:hypothetical protein
MFDDKFVKSLIVALVPLMIVGVFAIMAEMSVMKSSMVRLETRLDLFMKYTESALSSVQK